MDNIQIISEIGIDGLPREYVIIDRGNGEFTSMPKSVYDTLPSNSSIPQAGE